MSASSFDLAMPDLAPEMPNRLSGFVVQQDDVCRVEKATVSQALNVWPGEAPTRLRAGLQDLLEGRRPSYNGSPPAPVGTVEFCRAWMSACRVHEPHPLDFPEALRAACGRRVECLASYDDAPDGCWVKPVRTKAWEAHRKGLCPPPGDGHPDQPVWATEHLALQAEWRVYVLHGYAVGIGRYDDGPDQLDVFEETALAWAQRTASLWASKSTTPSAYALDVAFTQDCRWVLVEVTDAWAIGYYRGTCSPLDYSRMLMARWEDILRGHPKIAAESQPTKQGVV